MAKYILAIDQGTTSTRAILFDAQVQVVGVSQKELTLSYPHNGWVEQDPEAIAEDVRFVCRDVLQKTGIAAQDVAAIGITNQRETTVVWDRDTGKPVYNAIVWQDRRTADMCADMRAQGLEDTFADKTGLLLDPYFSGTKLRWILDNVEGVRARAKAGQLLFGTMDCYVLWHLTGGRVHATDMTNASRTLMYNIVEKRWDAELLQLLDITDVMLPDVRGNSGEFGITTPDFIGHPVVIGGMAGDQQAALIGQACFTPGMVKSTYGTGCFVLMNIGETFRRSAHRLLTTVGYHIGGRTVYALEGSIFVSGAAIQWLRDGLGIIKSAGESEALAKSVADNGGVYMVPAFTGLGAPYWDPHARATLTGLTRGATAAHIVRAGLEAQAYQTEDLMRAMASDAGAPITTFRVDGGMVKNNWVCQFIADITQKPVERPVVVETTALGAAYLAGLHVGIFASLDDIAASWQNDRDFAPEMAPAVRDSLYAGWQKAVRQTLAP
jgi:glycerol kinase